MTTFNAPVLEHPIRTAPPSDGRELSRLISAAVVNQRFCRLLLSDPAKALTNGYNGEEFYLASNEQDLILSIRAASLADFAMQLVTHQNGKSRYGNGTGSSSWGKRQVHQKV